MSTPVRPPLPFLFSRIPAHLAQANNTIETPYCIFTPRTASAAAFAIRTFTAHSTVFAVRSGGHSYNAGFSSTSSGVLLDLQYLNSISYSAENNTVKVGTGNTWGDVYRFLESYNVTVPGGRASTVGVGGLSLGGGLNFYLYEHGFSADSVLEYEVVTADGDVIIVDAERYPDLFVALKGSGAPFALVTAFTYRAVQQGKIWGGGIYGGNSTVESGLQAVARFMAPSGGMEDVNSHLIAAFGLESADAVVSGVSIYLLFYRMDVEETPLAFEDIVETAEKEPLYNTLEGGRTVGDLTEEIAADVVGARQITVPWTVISPDTQTLQALYAIFYEVWAPLMATVQGLATTLTMVPLGFGHGRNVNVMGLEPGVNYLVMSNFAGWTEAGDDTIVRDALREVLTRSKEYLATRQKLGRWM
jgi:FAD/FMN-containing dehydrogenase